MHTQVKSLNFESCHILIAGDFHSAFLNEKNELFMWGNNQSGQLGLGLQDQIVTLPQKVDTQAIADDAAQYFEGNESSFY